MAGEALLAAVASLPGHRYAVVDGAHFDDLPAFLKAAGFESIPLYLEASDGPGVKVGPHLVSVEEPTRARQVVDLIGDKPAATFWSWPGATHSLRRHLRGLNLAEIPDEKTGRGYETVLFRHWDPNVLAVALPALRTDQQSRFLGEAQGLVFDATDHAGITVAARPQALPPKPTGLLRFEVEQIQKVTSVRTALQNRRLAEHLRNVAPVQTRELDQNQLEKAILRYTREANQFGLTSQRDVGRWSFLQILSGNNFHLDPSVTRLFGAEIQASPSTRLNVLFDAIMQR